MQHSVYLSLWILSAFNIIFLGPDLHNFISDIVPREEYGTSGTEPFRVILTGFSVFTIILHQGYIYHCFGAMEKNKTGWKDDFRPWFGSRTEIFLRNIAFVILLISVGKIPGIEKYFESNHFHEFTPIQMMLVFGSVFLFLILTFWNLGAGINGNNWKYFWSDFLALIFWVVIASLKLFNLNNYWVFIPLIIMSLYGYSIIKRIYRSFKLKQII